MTVPNTSTNVIFPTAQFEKQYDTLLVKGKAKFFPVTDTTHLRPEDNNKFSISIELSKEDYLALKKIEMDGGRKLCGLKKSEVTVKDADGNKMLDEEDEPIKEFSHYQITLRLNNSYKDKKTGEIKYNIIPIKVKGHPDFKHTDKIGSESEVVVKGSLFESDYQGKLQMSLNINSIGVVNLVEVTGGGFDPFAGMGFDDVAEVAKGAVEVKQSPMPSAETPKQEPVDQFEDDFDDVPF